MKSEQKQDETTPAGDAREPGFPCQRTVGIDGILVSFGGKLSEPANRAALAFRAALDRSGFPGIVETSSSLASAYLRFDPMIHAHEAMRQTVADLLTDRDWYAAPLPSGRRLWRIPTVYGTDLAPQLGKASAAAGMTADQAVRSISQTRVRVLTLGFAPGMPYLGELAPDWNIPRQTALTRQVPVGALAVAIRQLVLFAVAAPTGWRHVGQTAFRPYQPGSDRPFVLAPGDEVLFDAVPADAYADLQAGGPDGGATWEELP